MSYVIFGKHFIIFVYNYLLSISNSNLTGHPVFYLTIFATVSSPVISLEAGIWVCSLVFLAPYIS